MSAGNVARSRAAWVAACLAATALFASPAGADEPLTLATVVQRAIAYDLQVKAAQARLDTVSRRPADPAEPARTRRADAFPTSRPMAPAPAAAPDGGRAAIEAAERELRRARDQAAARAAIAALEVQKQDALVAVARRRVDDLQRLALRPADPPRRGKSAVPAPAGEADAARRRAESALVDARAARLTAMDRLESVAGHLPTGLAPFKWPESEQPNPVGEEALARERAEQLARQLREAREAAKPRPPKADAEPRSLAQAVQARDAVADLEARAVEAGHELALARLNEQLRLGTWQQALADTTAATAVAAAVDTPAVAVAAAPAATPVAAAAAAGQAVDASAEAAFSRWAEAWRRKNIDAYLASYASDFAPAGMSREAWRAQRVARVTRPGPLSIAIERPRWQRTAADTVEVRFVQHYRSPAYTDSSDKRIVWRNGPGGWRIVEEASRVEVSAQESRRKPG